ncbi:tetratricopeptide repeat protein [Chloroflexota bacterium]
MKSRIVLMVISILLILSLLSMSSISCGTEFESLALELLEEWADTHDVNPTTAGGTANLAMRAASGSTGDEEADAAIGLTKIVSDIYEGDKLMDEGKKLRTQGKLDEAAKKMDEAIAMRPDDWTYHISRTAIAYQQNDLETARHHDIRGSKIVYGRKQYLSDLSPQELVRYHTQCIDELESSSLSTWIRNKDTGDEMKYWYYNDLRLAYSERARITNSELDKETAEHYRKLMIQYQSTQFD